jgi:uncharacterized membrane protein
LLDACGGGQQPAGGNRAETIAPAEAVVAPIKNAAEVRKLRQKTPSRGTPRPLVSRGTSAAVQTSLDKVVRYRAIGTEPFWAVTVHGATVDLERPDHTPFRFSITEDSDDKAIRYTGDGFTLTATEGPCNDGMSDAIWSDRVQIAFRDGTFKGCGGLREDMREYQR